MTCAFYFIVYDIVFHIERKINYFILFIYVCFLSLEVLIIAKNEHRILKK
jgi:hypothetical protein